MNLHTIPKGTHDDPEIIKLKVNEYSHCEILINTEPYDWGGVTFSFSNLKEYETYALTGGFWVLALWMNHGLLPGLDVARNKANLRIGLDLLSLWANRIPEGINESLGIHPVGRTGDCIGAVRQYYPEYYKPGPPKKIYSSSLLASAYLITGRTADVGFAFLRKFLDQLEDWKDELTVRLISENNLRAYEEAIPLVESDEYSSEGSVSIIGSDEPPYKRGGVLSLGKVYSDERHQKLALSMEKGIAHLGVMRWLGDSNTIGSSI
jgi:hypothetical protein